MSRRGVALRLALRLSVASRKLRVTAGLLGWRRQAGPPRTYTSRTRATPDDPIPVVMCVWARVDRLERTLSLLASQTRRDMVLHLWNNNAHAREHVEAAVAATDLAVDVVHSARNAGGFGRFYVARELAARGHRRVVFIDDDLTFGPTLLEELLEEARPATISSSWAFHLLRGREYRERIEARPGERVKYCGTRGMICDTAVFADARLFECPRRFWFVEDLWLSYCADHLLGWTLQKSHVRVDADEDGLDQFHYLHPTKARLLRHLVRAGWELEPPEGLTVAAG
jgi:glycosyltransferase involved in cell wall biosynthesis